MAVKKPATTKAEAKVEAEVKETPKKAPKLEKINESLAQTRMAARYKAEKQVEISISPLYADEFSRNLPVSLNGVRINIPVDGRTYKVPYSFAMEIKDRIAAADEKFKRLKRMANVQDNFEHSPGELKLFR